MNDRECEEVYTALVDILQQERLGWVVLQVEEHVRLGILEEKEVAAESVHRGDGAPARRRRSSRAKFVSRRDFSPQERLRELVDAVEQSVANTADMGLAIARTMASKGAETVVLTGESSEAEQRVTEIVADDAESRSSKAQSLRALLDELKREID